MKERDYELLKIERATAFKKLYQGQINFIRKIVENLKVKNN